jgi:hypothetical protein
MPSEKDEHDSRDHASTLRQKLHWATGDRDAEAKALADESPDDVTPEDAKVAVLRAHGDAGVDAPGTRSTIATPADAEAVHEESTHRHT